MTFNHAWGENFECWTGFLPPPAKIPQSFIRLKCFSSGQFCETAKDGSLDFPADGKLREFFVTGWEYLAAKETGRLQGVRVIESYTFTSLMNFGPYVEHFYALKKSLNPKSAEYLYAKLFLNSLYGKFAADPDNYRNYYVIPSGALELGSEGKISEPRRFQGGNLERSFGSQDWLSLVSTPLLDSQQRFYNVATAASITGFVRSLLWRGLLSSRNSLYCDTDSIICEKLGVTVSKELGEWKEEIAECGHPWKKVAIAGKKLYAVWCGKCPWTGRDENGNPPKGWKIASKGAQLSGPQIFEIAKGAEIKWRKEAPSMSLKAGTKFIERRIRRTK